MRLTAVAAGWPSGCLPKLSPPGSTATRPGTPCPTKATCCGALIALSLRLRVTTREPSPVGVKIIETEHFANGASAPTPVLDVIAKSPLIFGSPKVRVRPFHCARYGGQAPAKRYSPPESSAL